MAAVYGPFQLRPASIPFIKGDTLFYIETSKLLALNKNNGKEIGSKDIHIDTRVPLYIGTEHIYHYNPFYENVTAFSFYGLNDVWSYHIEEDNVIADYRMKVEPASIYVGNASHIDAVDAKTGRTKWKYEFQTTQKHIYPETDKDKIYVGSNPLSCLKKSAEKRSGYSPACIISTR